MSQSLGDRIKSYEKRYTGDQFLPGVPVVARLDGKRFSKFTKHMNKPWDPKFTEAMIATTMQLVEKTHARIGYTQSDEISLVFLAENQKSELWLGGRVQKMTSILASMGTAFFNERLGRTSSAGPAFFDCRVFQVPSKAEAVNVLVWREFDAVRNSIQMLAHHHFSHKYLHGKNTSEMQDMLMQERGLNWNDTSSCWKRGTYVQRQTRTAPMTPEMLAHIPEHVRHAIPAEVIRSEVVIRSMPPLTKVVNRVDVVFDAADLIIENPPENP